MELTSNLLCDQHFSYLNANIYPRLAGYQLLGDSIFVRLSKNILHQPSRHVDGKTSNGFCVSGQRIKQLGVAIKEKQYLLSKNVIILIGTNDVLVGNSLDKIIEHYKSLILLLQLRGVEKMVILTIPPIPKLALTRSHWQIIRTFKVLAHIVRTFNQFLLDQDDPTKNIKVIDILPQFLKNDSPIFSCTLSISTLSESNTPMLPTVPMKRRTSYNLKECDSPKRIKTVPDPIATEKIGDDISDFCRYLNRVNRLEKEDELFSSEDEGEFRQARPFIENRFWRSIKKSLQIDEDDLLPLNISEGLNQNSSLSDTTLNSSKGDEITDPKSEVPEFHQTIMRYTNSFLRLDFFEMFFYGKTKMDMVHPNIDGLRIIRDLIFEAL